VIDLDRVIDDELDRLQRVDPLRVAAEPDDAVAHGGEIDHGWDAGEVLKQDARGREGDLLLHLRRDVPPAKRFDILRVDEPRVFTAQQVLEQDFQRIRQPGQTGEPFLLENRKAEDVEGLPADRQRRACVEGILGSHPHMILQARPAVQANPSW
jgi:hypothetical protein